MNSDNNSEKYLRDMKEKNPEKLKAAADAVKSILGGHAKGLDALLGNEKALKELTRKLSPSDMSKISKLIDNPEVLKKLLGSDKAKDGLKKFFNE